MQKVQFVTESQPTLLYNRIGQDWKRANLRFVVENSCISIVMGHESTLHEPCNRIVHVFSSQSSMVDDNAIVRMYPVIDDHHHYTEYHGGSVMERIYAAIQDIMKFHHVREQNVTTFVQRMFKI